MRLLVAMSLVLGLGTGCVTTPDWDNDPSVCWKYGVDVEANTGRMSSTPLDSIPVVKGLSYDELLVLCGVTDERNLSGYHMDGRSMAVRACYDPVTDTIYEYYLNAGSYFTNHEKCHIVYGRNHNACTGYGIGKDQSACNWK